MNKRKGFTLVEIIVILAVISILVGVAVPVALRVFERTAEDTTREEMDNIKKAVIGDLRKLQGSFRSDLGYLGDIGCLPDDLRRIFRNDAPPLPSSLPSYAFDPAKQAGAGWKGPYISGSVGEEFDRDQWGNAYTYTPAAGLCPLTATLTSSGASTSSTSDDITLSISANETTATVRGTVKDTAGAGLGSVSLEFYSAANNGNLTTTPGTTDANGNYSFLSVPFGPRAVMATPTLGLVSGSVTVTGGANNNVNFQVRNYSTASITVTHMTIGCAGTGAAQNSDVLIDGTIVQGTNDVACGTQRDITDNAFAASPTPPAPLRVVVDSPDTQLPDLIVRGGGTARTITLEDFETSGGGNVDMRGGKVITVTFYSSPTTVITTITVVTP